MSDRQICWRVLDSQYFGTPQRRRRVFIVTSFGTRRAAQILFECEGLSRNFTPCSQQTETTAPPLKDGAVTCYGLGRDAFNCGQNAKFGLSLSENIASSFTKALIIDISSLRPLQLQVRKHHRIRLLCTTGRFHRLS